MKTITTLGACSLLGLLTACGTAPMRYPHSSEVPISGLPADIAHLGLDIENRSGSVKVIVDRGFDAPRITASTTNASGVRIPSTWAAADLDSSGPFPVLRVLATPPVGHDDVYTDLVIRLPAVAGVRVRNRVGPVSLQGVGGAVDVQNGSEVEPGGSITAIFAAPADEPILLRSGGGPIALDLPRGSTGRVNANARSGNVTILGGRADFTQSASHHGEWSGVINGGDNDIRLETGRGDITVRVLP